MKNMKFDNYTMIYMLGWPVYRMSLINMVPFLFNKNELAA